MKEQHTTATHLYRVQKNRHNKKSKSSEEMQKKELPGRRGQCPPVGRKEEGMTGAGEGLQEAGTVLLPS